MPNPEEELYANQKTVRGNGGVGRILFGLIAGTAIAGLIGALVFTGPGAAYGIAGLAGSGAIIGAIFGWNPKTYYSPRQQSAETGDRQTAQAPTYQLTPGEYQHLQDRLHTVEKRSHTDAVSQPSPPDIHTR